MSGRVLEETLPDECFTEEEFDILLGPALGQERLQEHHDLLKIHLEQFRRPLYEKGRTHIEMELRKALFLGLFASCQHLHCLFMAMSAS